MRNEVRVVLEASKITKTPRALQKSPMLPLTNVNTELDRDSNAIAKTGDREKIIYITYSGGFYQYITVSVKNNINLLT